MENKFKNNKILLIRILYIFILISGMVLITGCTDNRDNIAENNGVLEKNGFAFNTTYKIPFKCGWKHFI